MIRFDSSGKCCCLFPLLLLLLVLLVVLVLLLLLPLALVEEAPAAAFCWTTTFLAILAQLEECVMLGLLLHQASCTRYAAQPVMLEPLKCYVHLYEIMHGVRSTPGGGMYSIPFAWWCECCWCLIGAMAASC